MLTAAEFDRQYSDIPLPDQPDDPEAPTRRPETAVAATKPAGMTNDLPPLVPLPVLLAEPAEPVRYLIDQLLPVGGRVVLAAQYKAGKTTVRDNLVRALADGGPFLDQFDTTPLPAGRTVVVIDNEMSRNQLRRWLADQGITRPERIHVVILRGTVAAFDLLNPTTRADWARALRNAGAAVVIFDCLRPVLDALGLDESRDAGRFLVAFDALLTESGADAAVVVHHMGHHGERSRGDSRIRDWPDVEWRLVRQTGPGDEPDPAAPRFFSAYGRDVDLPEGALTYDPNTRHLTYATGTRRDTRKAQQATNLRPFVVRAVGADPGISAGALVAALRSTDQAPPFRDREVSQVARGLAEDGVIRIEDTGPGRPKRHYLVTTSNPVPTPSTDALDALPLTPSTPSIYGRGGGRGGPDRQNIPPPLGRGSPETSTCRTCGRDSTITLINGQCRRCHFTAAEQ